MIKYSLILGFQETSLAQRNYCLLENTQKPEIYVGNNYMYNHQKPSKLYLLQKLFTLDK